jgi:hypothetical protein
VEKHTCKTNCYTLQTTVFGYLWTIMKNAATITRKVRGQTFYRWVIAKNSLGAHTGIHMRSQSQ